MSDLEARESFDRHNSQNVWAYALDRALALTVHVFHEPSQISFNFSTACIWAATRVVLELNIPIWGDGDSSDSCKSQNVWAYRTNVSGKQNTLSIAMLISDIF